ncbi:MAG: DUF1887 family protein [Clostridia bacterium]|nr:DUF1887 family protein [Clostridia bacterium]
MMKTLIELYDDRPIENVLGTEMFRPERTVFICPPDIAANIPLHNRLREYFKHRGIFHECIFIGASLLDTNAVVRKLQQVIERYPDCAMDIAGGTDAALFAGGLLSAEHDIPVFTYSRKRNRFYNIRNAAFAENVPCTVQLSVEDCFLMAGGSMRQGRVDNAILAGYLPVFDPFFELYLRHRREWPKAITYIQRVSQKESQPLHAEGGRTVKGEHGGRISVPETLLEELEQLQMIRNLSILEDTVQFDFADAQIRTWLRDVGSVLELYIYKACLDSGLFTDVRTSAVVDWLGDKPDRDSVTNELDVMASAGIRSFFISCKTCDVKTEALNELAILRDRFGGQMAQAAIVTAEYGRSPMRHRAIELGIDVIDIKDLSDPGVLRSRIKALLR